MEIPDSVEVVDYISLAQEWSEWDGREDVVAGIDFGPGGIWSAKEAINNASPCSLANAYLHDDKCRTS